MLIDRMITDWNFGGSQSVSCPERIALTETYRTDRNQISFRGLFEGRVVYGSVWAENEKFAEEIAGAMRQNAGETIQQIRRIELRVD